MVAKTTEGFVHQWVELRRYVIGGRGVLYRLNEDVKVVCFSVDRVRLSRVAVSTDLELPASTTVIRKSLFRGVINIMKLIVIVTTSSLS